jgi:hypothetical protein
MKFRKISCDCCKSTEAARLCKAPTYVISEITDESNVIFVLMNKSGRTPCRGPVASARAGIPAQSRTCDDADAESRDPSGAPAWKAEDGASGPAWMSSRAGDYPETESPIRRNRRWLEDGSGFWPRGRRRDADGAMRDWE